MRSPIHFLILVAAWTVWHQVTIGVEPVRHINVYRQEGHFAGWPTHYGCWSWGDEILVGFMLGNYDENGRDGHGSHSGRLVLRQARSLDGGETWKVEIPDFLDENDRERQSVQLEQPIDFSNRDLAIRLSRNRLYFSLDRGRDWQGPFELPNFQRRSLRAETDYIVEGPNRVTAFITASKEKGGEGRPLCIRTEDGGLTWQLVGWIGPEPPEAFGYGIMPATVRVGEQGYLSMIRRGGMFDGEKRWWLEPWLSPDQGESWFLLKSPVIENAGNPASLTRLSSGLIAMTYGWRRSPYGMRVQVSEDDGQTWGPAVSLRSDAATWDIGYPQTVERTDGRCVTIYYYRDSPAAERFIACSIWDPESPELLPEE